MGTKEKLAKKDQLTEKQQLTETYDPSIPKNGDNLTLNLLGAEVNMSVRIECTLSYGVTATSLRKLADLVDAVYKLQNEDIEAGTIPQ